MKLECTAVYDHTVVSDTNFVYRVFDHAGKQIGECVDKTNRERTVTLNGTKFVFGLGHMLTFSAVETVNLLILTEKICLGYDIAIYTRLDHSTLQVYNSHNQIIATISLIKENNKTCIQIAGVYDYAKLTYCIDDILAIDLAYLIEMLYRAHMSIIVNDPSNCFINIDFGEYTKRFNLDSIITEHTYIMSLTTHSKLNGFIPKYVVYYKHDDTTFNILFDGKHAYNFIINHLTIHARPFTAKYITNLAKDYSNYKIYSISSTLYYEIKDSLPPVEIIYDIKYVIDSYNDRNNFNHYIATYQTLKSFIGIFFDTAGNIAFRDTIFISDNMLIYTFFKVSNFKDTQFKMYDLLISI